MKPHFLAISCVISFCISSLSAQDDLSKLEQSARSFVEAFNAGDADAIASLFVQEGELVLASGELVIGRANLAEHYSAAFSESDRPQAALEAGSVRFLTEDMAIEEGTVHLTEPSGEISSHFYTAVHAKQEDGTWLFASVRDEIGDHALPAEKLFALEWLIGDWVAQINGSDTWISFSWSDDGPYIDAKALTESPEGPSTASTMRIGWNERDESFVSWAFDAEGGYNYSTWISPETDQWLMKTQGITSEGETNTVTQEVTLNSSGESFSWSKRDQIIGGVLQDGRTIQFVKRPPAPSSASSNAE